MLNNPLKYTDPSGYKFLAKIKNWIVSIIKGNGEYEGPESESGGSSLIIFNDGSFMASGSAAQRAFSFIRAEMAVPGITNSIEKYLSTINTIYSSSQVNIYFRSGENSFEAKFGNFDSQQYLLSYEMFKEASTTYLKDNGLADNASSGGAQFSEFNPNVDFALTVAGSTSDVIGGAALGAVAQLGRGVKGVASVSKIASGAGWVGIAATGAVAAYEYKTGVANTHTLVDIGVTATLTTIGIGAVIAVGAVAAAPVVVGAAIVGGVWGVVSASGGSEAIDRWSNDWGRKILYE